MYTPYAPNSTVQWNLNLWLYLNRPKPRPPVPPIPEGTVFFNYSSMGMTEDVLQPVARSTGVFNASRSFVRDWLFNITFFYKANIGNAAIPASDVSYDSVAETVTVTNIPAGATGPLYLYQLASWRDIMANTPQIYNLVNRAQTTADTAETDAQAAITDSAAALAAANTAEADAQTALTSAAAAQTDAATAITNAAAAQTTADTAETNAQTAIADAATALSTADSKFIAFSNLGSTGNYADGARTTFNDTGIPADIDINSLNHSFSVQGFDFKCVSVADFDASDADAKVFKLTYAGPAVGNLITTKYAPCVSGSLERVEDGTGAVVPQPLDFLYTAVVV